MTRSMHDSQDLRPAVPATEPVLPKRTAMVVVIRSVKIFTVVSALAGVGFLTYGFAHPHWHCTAYGMMLTVLAGIGGSTLVLNAMAADRHAFYRDGYLRGWMRGFHGH